MVKGAIRIWFHANPIRFHPYSQLILNGSNSNSNSHFLNNYLKIINLAYSAGNKWLDRPSQPSSCTSIRLEWALLQLTQLQLLAFSRQQNVAAALDYSCVRHFRTKELVHDRNIIFSQQAWHRQVPINNTLHICMLCSNLVLVLVDWASEGSFSISS